MDKTESDFSPPKVLHHGVSQKRLQELSEDWDALCEALRPFAEFYELVEKSPYNIAVKIDLQAHLEHAKHAKEVLEFIYSRLDARRLSQAERDLAGHGDVCKLCGSVIEGSEDFELEGYCSSTCKREDVHSEWPAPDPMFRAKAR
jgi:DNA repair exonuclease SbcCD ATPase subunit